MRLLLLAFFLIGCVLANMGCGSGGTAESSGLQQAILDEAADYYTHINQQVSEVLDGVDLKAPPEDQVVDKLDALATEYEEKFIVLGQKMLELGNDDARRSVNDAINAIGEDQAETFKQAKGKLSALIDDATVNNELRGQFLRLSNAGGNIANKWLGL